MPPVTATACHVAHTGKRVPALLNAAQNVDPHMAIRHNMSARPIAHAPLPGY